jgi:hypothetical protein
MSTKEVQETLIRNMRQWMKVENASVTSTAKVMEKTDNPVLHTIMEIIQTDSRRHYHVQDLIARSLESETVKLTPDEMADIWDLIEHHIEIEKKTIAMAEEALKALKGRKMVVQEYLLHYLLEDEQKHNNLLDQLSVIKKGMYPYG